MSMNEAELVEKYRERLLYYGLRRLRDRNAAEEFAQEVLVRAVEAIRTDSVEDESRLGSFIFGIAANLIKERAREDLRRRKQVDTDRVEIRLPWLEDPEAGVLLEEERETVRSALRELSEKDRELLVKCFYDPVPLEQLGEEMGISYSSIRKRKSRALNRLKEILEKSVTKPQRLSLIK